MARQITAVCRCQLPAMKYSPGTLFETPVHIAVFFCEFSRWTNALPVPILKGNPAPAFRSENRACAARCFSAPARGCLVRVTFFAPLTSSL